MTSPSFPSDPQNPMDIVEAVDLDDRDVAAAVADAMPAVKGAIEALTFGNRKHGIHRWHHQQDVEWRLTEKLLRHLFRYFMARTAPDVDSGLHHLKHVMANAVLLFEQERLKGGIMDGPGPESR